jgi:hypothetical protein
MKKGKQCRMRSGVVYILTNPCLDGWVKIGMTERSDIEQRLHELNSPPNIPLSYRCYAVYEVENPFEVEKHIHSIIDRIDDSLHAREQLENGRIREREFFKISPETAYGIFKDISLLRNDVEKLKLYTPTQKEAQEQELAENKSKRSNSSFKMLNIAVGEKIEFLYDNNIVAEVFDKQNKIKYNDDVYSVTALAIRILVEKYGWSEGLHVNGWKFFTKDGITLYELRDKMESANDED